MPARATVLELKRMIKKIHAQGIAGHSRRRAQPYFECVSTISTGQIPYGRYYFRTNGLNWSNVGTGNQIFDDRNQRPFAYKLVLDNIKYW